MVVNEERVVVTPTSWTYEFEVSQVDGNMIVDGLRNEPRIKGIKVKPKKSKVVLPGDLWVLLKKLQEIKVVKINSLLQELPKLLRSFVK